jgi:hypothetical protein
MMKQAILETVLIVLCVCSYGNIILQYGSEKDGKYLRVKRLSE